MIAVLEYISLVIGISGVLVITWGTVITIIEFVRLEFRQARGGSICSSREMMRHHYGSYILLGLEFLIAADIVNTLMQPGLLELAALGAIVVIRTTLSFFLNREMDNHTCEVPEGRNRDG